MRVRSPIAWLLGSLAAGVANGIVVIVNYEPTPTSLVIRIAAWSALLAAAAAAIGLLMMVVSETRRIGGRTFGLAALFVGGTFAGIYLYIIATVTLSTHVRWLREWWGS